MVQQMVFSQTAGGGKREGAKERNEMAASCGDGGGEGSEQIRCWFWAWTACEKQVCEPFICRIEGVHCGGRSLLAYRAAVTTKGVWWQLQQEKLASKSGSKGDK